MVDGRKNQKKWSKTAQVWGVDVRKIYVDEVGVESYAGHLTTTMQSSGEGVWTSSTRVNSDIDVVIKPFTGFGRLAGLRRQLLSIPVVLSARIVGYEGGEARFRVSLASNASASDLCIPGTKIVQVTASLVALAVVAR